MQPDMEDDFRPNLLSPRIVCCLHCGQSYQEKEIRWDQEASLWVCKNWPECNGAGLGFDIFHHDDPQGCLVHGSDSQAKSNAGPEKSEEDINDKNS